MTKPSVNVERRRVIQFCAIAAGLTMAGMPVASLAKNNENIWRWRGIALGAEAEILLVHNDEAEAKRILDMAVLELKRLEGLFSLYDPQSELSVLNKTGRLDNPSLDMVELLSLSNAISKLTFGAFDITVQPLWLAHANHFASSQKDDVEQLNHAIEGARKHVDYSAVNVSRNEISFAKNDMAITLNGIAQGFITERISALFSGAGMHNILTNMGEIKALGRKPNNQPWQVGIEGYDGMKIELNDRAIATSKPAGTIFDAEGRYHHLFSPKSGHSQNSFAQVSVVAPNAALADGLSTGLAVLEPELLTPVLENIKELGVDIYAKRNDGTFIQA